MSRFKHIAEEINSPKSKLIALWSEMMNTTPNHSMTKRLYTVIEKLERLQADMTRKEFKSK